VLLAGRLFVYLRYMETAYAAYVWIIYILWLIFYAPLIVMYVMYLGFSTIFKNFYINRYGVFHPFFKTLFKYDAIVMKDLVVNLPISLLGMINPYLELNQKDKTMKAIDPRKPHEFVVKSERDLPKDQQTVFLVKYLTAHQQFELRDEMYQVKGIGKARNEKFLTGTMERKTLKLGLVGWKNFTDDSGSQLEFKSNDLDNMLDYVPPTARAEIASHIRGDSELDEGEE
jgi:hypothetical protein